MKGKKLNYDFLECARNMPPLSHLASEEFDIRKSEAAKWIADQPEIMQKIFDMASRKKIIVYDPETKKWKGVDA